MSNKIIISIACFLFPILLQAQTRTPASVKQATSYRIKPQGTGAWQGFEQVKLTIGPHEAYYVKPKRSLPGNPWIWRASFPDWHTTIDTILLNRGFHLAYINVDNEYGSPYAMQVWDRFYNFLTQEAGFAGRVSLEGCSRGGLYVYGWAKRNPEKISCIYNEAPVCDIKSWPGGKFKGQGDAGLWKQLKDVYHMSEQEAMAYQDNPIDNLEGLASLKVPVIHVIGNNDHIVPNAENTLVFAQRYAALGGPVSVFTMTTGPQDLAGHHFPIEYPERLAKMIADYTYPVAQPLSHASFALVRKGLDQSYKKFSEGGAAKVAFLGGSITFNPGWTEKISRYLRERFPNTQFHFINAGIPSLGSNAHAFRLKNDVLDSGKIDLMFVESAVNDFVNGVDSVTQLRALEGIVRHARKVNPSMDLILMAFADPDKIRDYNRNKIPLEIRNQELVADYYGLPSINLAKEVALRINHGEFSWEWDFKELHPAAFGQELYAASIKNFLNTCFIGTPKMTYRYDALPKAFDPYNFENGNYYSIRQITDRKGWSIEEDWVPHDQAETRAGFVHKPMLVTSDAGSYLKLKFSGRAIGLASVTGPNEGILLYKIDGGTEKSVDLYTQWSSWLHLPRYILLDQKLKPGQHVIELKMSNEKNSHSKGNTAHIIYFLIN